LSFEVLGTKSTHQEDWEVVAPGSKLAEQLNPSQLGHDDIAYENCEITYLLKRLHCGGATRTTFDPEPMVLEQGDNNFPHISVVLNYEDTTLRL